MSRNAFPGYILLVVSVAAISNLQASDTDQAACLPTSSGSVSCSAAEQANNTTIAVGDGWTLGQNDLNDKLHERINRLDADIADARKVALQSTIDDLILQAEAKRRGVPARDLYYTEVIQKIVTPTDAEVKAKFDSMHAEGRSLDSMRSGIVGTLRNDRETLQYAEFAKNLQSRFPVQLLADPNGSGIRENSVLAKVGKQTVTWRMIATRVDAAVFDLRWKLWSDENDAVNKLIHERLLKDEAARRGMSSQALMSSEVDNKLNAPSDQEIAAYYEKYRAFFKDGLSIAKPKIIEQLRIEQRGALEKQLYRKLEAGHEVRPLFAEPAPPTLAIDADSISRGSDRATVTIVEFGDFQCPPCGYMYGVLEEALKPYGDRIRYVFRHYPMYFHEFALQAAIAAEAAKKQGRFWEYADTLFHNQNALDVDSLKRYADQIGLDPTRFAQDLDSPLLAAKVIDDRRAGSSYGVKGTPTFFINGRRLGYGDYNVDGIRKDIDHLLTQTTTPVPHAHSK